LKSKKLLPVLAFFVLVASLLFIAFLAGFVEPVQAASENYCEYIGSAGSVQVYRCQDPVYGNIFYANSAGFIGVLEY